MTTILDPNFVLLKYQNAALAANCSLDSSIYQSTIENVTTIDENNLPLPPCDPSVFSSLETDNFNLYHNESLLDRYDPYDTSHFYIKRPHDMLHPSEINPAFFPIILTHTFAFLVGVIGNCVVIATWTTHGKFRSPTAIFLVSLAIADLLLLLVLVPLETLEYFMITWGGLSSICKTIAYVEMISAMSTVLNLVAVSIERFLVIVYPMRARSWCTMSSTRIGLIFIWGLALVLSTPVLLTKHTSQITYYNETTSLTLYYCFDIENDLTFIVAVYQLVVMFIGPAIFMCVCYWVVIKQLWVSTRSVNAMTRTDNSRRQALHQSQSNASMSSRFTTGASSLLLKKDSPDFSTATDPKHVAMFNGNKAIANEHERPCWLQYFNLAYLWNRWRQSKEVDSLQKVKNNGNLQNGTDVIKSCKLRRESKDSNATTEKCTLGNSCLLCCLPSCISVGGGRHRSMGDEISECTMTSTYQMTSYVDNCNARLRMEQCNLEMQSPVDGDEDGDEQIFCTGSDINVGEEYRMSHISGSTSRPHVTTMDNHAMVQPQNYTTKTLANNVMEITRSRFQVIKMLILIVILFLLCWGPRLFMNVLVKLGLPTYSTWIYNTRIVCNLLSFVHSALNPLIYGFMSSNFRAMVFSSCRRHRNRGGTGSGGGEKWRSTNQAHHRSANQHYNKRTVNNSATFSSSIIVDEQPRNTSQLSRY